MRHSKVMILMEEGINIVTLKELLGHADIKTTMICLNNQKLYYNLLFAAVWNTLRSFGYTHYGVESGAVCVLHTCYSDFFIIPILMLSKIIG